MTNESNDFNFIIKLDLAPTHPVNEVSRSQMLKYLETLIAGDPQMITLPSSNNTVAALQWSGWAETENSAPTMYTAWSELGEKATLEYAGVLVREAVKAAKRNFRNDRVDVLAFVCTRTLLRKLHGAVASQTV